MSARVLTPAELADMLSALGMHVPAGAVAAVVPLTIRQGMAPVPGMFSSERLRPPLAMSAGLGIGVLDMVHGPGVSIKVVACWRFPPW